MTIIYVLRLLIMVASIVLVKKIPKIIICGSIAIDRIMNFPGSFAKVIRPDKLHVLSLSVLLDELVDTQGGVGANIAYTLALLGESPVLIGSVGKDATEFVLKLTQLGINTENIYQSGLKTASYTVLTDSDDNQIGGFYPGAMFDSETLSFEKWKGENVFTVISPHDPKAMRRQVEECRKNKFRLFYDVSQQVNNIEAEDIKSALPCTELLILNDYEFGVLCDKSCLTASELFSSVPVVVITKGAKGSEIGGKNIDTNIHVSSAQINGLVDPTGAGDAFRAGFLYGYIRGLDLELCAQMGSVTSAYVIEKKGTQEHFFTKEEFKIRFRQNYQNKITI
jgi:adenosine kinase